MEPKQTKPLTEDATMQCEVITLPRNWTDNQEEVWYSDTIRCSRQYEHMAYLACDSRIYAEASVYWSGEEPPPFTLL